MRFRTLPLLLASLSLACDPADNVRVQELPPLDESSIEARLGLPVLEGAWRFAGWELAEGDSLGLEAELPALGVLALEAQQRDSLGGYYLAEGGERAPLYGEVRRDSVVALVAFLQEDDGRYLVGEVQGDTLWVEATTLVDPGTWRPGARPAFVRSRTPITRFVRIRGTLPPPPPVDSAGPAAAQDSVARPEAAPGGEGRAAAPAEGAVGAGQRVQPPAARETEAVQPPTPVPDSAPRAQPEPPARRPQPPVERREPPRVLGVPVERDTADDQ